MAFQVKIGKFGGDDVASRAEAKLEVAGAFERAWSQLAAKGATS